MASEAALNLVIGLKDNASGGLSKISSTLGTLGKASLAVAGGGILALGAGLAGVVTTGLGFNNSMEQASAKINAFTKDADATAAILDMVRERAAKTPFAFEEMANAAAALGPTAKQSGVALEDLIAQAEILAASNPAEGLEGAVFALKEATGGDFLSIIERFNLPKQRLMELKEQGVPALEAVRTAMTEMGYDADLVSNMANTASGRWSTLMDTFTTLAATITAPIFEGVSKGMGDLQVLLDANMPKIQEFATLLGEKVGQAMAWLASDGIPLAVSAFTTLSELWNTTLYPALVAIGDVLNTTVIPAFTAVATWATENWTTIEQVGIAVGVAVAAFQTLSTIAAVIGSVTTAVAGMGTAITAAGGTVAAIVAVLGGPLTIALGAIALAAAGLALAWTNNWGDIQGKTQAFTDWWSATAVPAIETGVTTLNEQSALMESAWNSDFEMIRGFIQSMQDKWNEAVIAVGVAMTTAIGHVTSFRDTVSEKIDEAVAFFTGLPGRITEAVGDLSTLLVQAGRDVIAGMISGITSKAADLASAAAKVVTDALAAARNAIGIKSPSRDFKDKVGIPAVDGIIEGMKDRQQKLNAMAKLVVVSALKDAADAVRSDKTLLGDAVVDTVAKDVLDRAGKLAKAVKLMTVAALKDAAAEIRESKTPLADSPTDGAKTQSEGSLDNAGGKMAATQFVTAYSAQLETLQPLFVQNVSTFLQNVGTLAIVPWLNATGDIFAITGSEWASKLGSALDSGLSAQVGSAYMHGQQIALALQAGLNSVSVTMPGVTGGGRSSEPDKRNLQAALASEGITVW